MGPKSLSILRTRQAGRTAGDRAAELLVTRTDFQDNAREIPEDSKEGASFCYPEHPAILQKS